MAMPATENSNDTTLQNYAYSFHTLQKPTSLHIYKKGGRSLHLKACCNLAMNLPYSSSNQPFANYAKH